MKFIKLASILAIFALLHACDTCEIPEAKVCGSSPDKPLVDLIVLMDMSSSMGNAAQAVSSSAATAIQNALDSCDSDLRVVYLGLDGTWAGTNFTQSHRAYLGSVGLVADSNHVGRLTEQGANGVEDLSKHFDWRPDACRAIFYISDEELDSDTPIGDFANEDQVTLEAIAAAHANDVTVFVHYIDKGKRDPRIFQNYKDISVSTGGAWVRSFNNNVNPQIYNRFMTKIVCDACNGCQLNKYF